MRNLVVVAAVLAAGSAQAQPSSVIDLAGGRICAVSLDGKRSGVLIFERTGNGLNVHVYRSPDGAPYQQMKANTDAAFIRSTAQRMQDQGIHPVTIDGNRLKFTNGLGAHPDLALSPDGKTITGKATTPDFPVNFDGFCVR
jgi:hypothetical protein